MRVAVTCTLLLLGLSLVDGCGRRRRRRSPPRDTTPPRIHCPGVPPLKADKFQDNAVVTWEEPVIAHDSKDGDITATRNGKAPGSLFSGDTTVRYSARDRSGNVASCKFTISVTVTTCPTWGQIPDGWKKCHTSDKMRRGSICRFGCYQGHYLDPPQSSRAVCEDSGQWTIPAQPNCLKVKCPVLQRDTQQVTIDCSDDNNYRSICTYSCATGYDVLPGFSRVLVCSTDGEWRGIVPQCVDTSPPEFQNCPHILTGYADRSKTSGQVSWDTPMTIDNSGHVTPTQIRGPTSETELDVGEYDVTYVVYDAVNNSAQCDFKVVVRQIKCHMLYPLPYTSVFCPDGRKYGSFCNFSCDDGAVLKNHPLAECKKTGEYPVSYGQWSFGDHQPYCKLESLCPALRAPNNGALPCDTWLHGTFCQTMCRESYIFNTDEGMEFMEKLLICGDAGTWNPSTDIPDCVQATAFEKMVYELDARYYYSGDCEDVKESIREKFIAIFTGNPHCHQPECSVDNVKVVCGDVTSRRKRSSEGEITVSSTFNVKPQGGDVALEAIQMKQILTSMVKDGNAEHAFDIETSNGTIAPANMDVSQADFNCPSGYEKNMRSFKCAECTAGHFYEQASGTCQKCPRGQYQPASRQATCHACPETKTTERESATSNGQCIDACRAGEYSSNGAQPCSPCDIGTYAEGYRTIICTDCPGTQITTTEGSKTRSDCHSFDIEFVEDVPDTAPATLTWSTDVELSELHISLWVQCIQCDNMLVITDANGNNILNIGGSSTLTVEIFSTSYDTDISIPLAITWHNMQVKIRKAGCELTMDNVVALSESCDYDTVVSSNFSISIGGGTFIGSVSEVNIWPEYVPAIDQASTSCNGDGNDVVSGDLLSWRQFTDATGSFILKRSKCDDFDNCLSNPCHNAGSCSDAIDSFRCACATGFTGSMCEVNINDCVDAPCDNDGQCVDGVASFTCDCPYGYTGILCETKVVDGAWIEWEQWTGCSVTCGQGQMSRVRVCEEPVNGGKDCEGDATESKECVEDDCVYECDEDPTVIENGALNCAWNDSTTTRFCEPTCDDGFDFDSDMYLYHVVCGPETGYTWNIKTTDNPNSQLPQCKEKSTAEKNTMNFTCSYLDLVGGPGIELDQEVKNKITTTVDGKVSQIENIKTGKCQHTQTYILSSRNDDEDDVRRRRSINVVSFNVEVTCEPTGLDECYDLLAAVATAIQDYVVNFEFHIQLGNTIYNVDANSTYVDGISECANGTVPVLHFCISCGIGTYQHGDFCERCPRGTYQDMPGQVSCKQCPKGWTTEGLQSREIGICNVQEPITKNLLMIVMLSVGGLVLVVVVVVTVVKLCSSIQRKHRIFYIQRKHRTTGSTMDTDTVYRMDTMVSSPSNKRFSSTDMFQDKNAHQPDIKKEQLSTFNAEPIISVMEYEPNEKSYE